MDSEGQVSSQAAISAIIVIAVTLLGLAALIVGALNANVASVAFGVVGTIVGGLLAALQPPGSLTNALKNVLNKTDKPNDKL